MRVAFFLHSLRYWVSEEMSCSRKLVVVRKKDETSLIPNAEEPENKKQKLNQYVAENGIVSTYASQLSIETRKLEINIESGREMIVTSFRMSYG